MKHLRLKRLVRDEKGSVSVEAVLMFPMLVWAFMAMYVFFEGLRESNINQKAAYAVADLLSRKDSELTQEYVHGMNAVYRWLSRSQNDTAIRVSTIKYDKTTDSHELLCSKDSGDKEELLQEHVATNIAPYIPIMPDSSSIIVVETWSTYTPLVESLTIMEVGLGESEIYNIIVAYPRFTGQLRCAGQGDGTGSEHDDQLEDPDTVAGDIDPDDDSDAADT